jgi:hypothetical protein
MTIEPLTFDQFLELLRVRIGLADAMNASELHDFKELMKDYAEVTPEGWYWNAFEELEAEGHLNPASSKLMGGGACGRLSADGRLYLQTVGGADTD